MGFFCLLINKKKRRHVGSIRGNLWGGEISSRISEKKNTEKKAKQTFSAAYFPHFRPRSHMRKFRIMRPKTARIGEKIGIYKNSSKVFVVFRIILIPCKEKSIKNGLTNELTTLGNVHLYFMKKIRIFSEGCRR